MTGKDKRVIYKVDQLNLNLGNRDYYLDQNFTKILDAYRQFMKTTAVELGANNASLTELEDVIDLEIALANITTPEEDRRNIEELLKPMTVAKLKESFPELHFEKWFKFTEQFNLHIQDTEIIDVPGSPYLEQLNNVLKKFSNRTIANYQVWKAIYGGIPYLAPSLRNNYRDFIQALMGIKTFPERWEECVDEVSEAMPWPVGALFVENYFKGSAKSEMDQLVTDIRAAMKNTIDKADWMDSETKAKAQEKLTVMVQKIAYPDDIFNDTWLMRDLQGANLTDNTYLNNALQLGKAQINRIIPLLYEPVNRSEWDMGPAVVNAYYSASNNEIVFPAAILQYPFYAPYLPGYMKYSRIGAVIGHEITHGYDDEGRQFDAKGNLVPWWSNKTLDTFTNGTKCFIDQYSKYKNEETGLYLNGENTVGENIADNGGIKLGYHAYQIWKNRTITEKKLSPMYEEPKLSGLHNYTIDQLFFLATGQIWCEISRAESIEEQIMNDVHSPADARVNVPLQNFEAFAKAYNCPEGSPMNPKEKCSIW